MLFRSDAESKQIGVVPISEALNIAKDQGYDLAEISPNANPPVCKLLDWGKYLYEQDKQAAKNRKKQKSSGLPGFPALESQL